VAGAAVDRLAPLPHRPAFVIVAAFDAVMAADHVSRLAVSSARAFVRKWEQSGGRPIDPQHDGITAARRERTKAAQAEPLTRAAATVASTAHTFAWSRCLFDAFGFTPARCWIDVRMPPEHRAGDL